MIEAFAKGVIEGVILFAFAGTFVLWVSNKFCNSMQK